MSRRDTVRAIVVVQLMVAAAAVAMAGLLAVRAATGRSEDGMGDLAIAVVLVLSGSVALVSWWGVRRLTSEIRRHSAAVTARVDEVREKQSRHEYRQEAALARIEQILGAVRADVEGQAWAQYGGQARELRFTGEGATRVLFVTSNGGGLGHLTRCLAVAEHNRDRLASAVVTLSTAHEAAASLGYDIEYIPSQTTTGVPWRQWHRRFARHLQTLLTVNEVDVVVFDGTWVYQSLTEVCERLDVPLVWMCRGTWRPGADTSQLEQPMLHCDHLLIPEDVSGSLLPVDIDARWMTVCPPVTIADSSVGLPASDAKIRLGLDPEARHVLVQVGGGNLADASGLATTAALAIREADEDLLPVVVASPLTSHGGVPADVATVVSGVYPLARYLGAFEFAVSGGGYNSVHENLALGVPAVYVPSATTVTDDQGARVRAVAQRGVGLVAESPDDFGDAIRRLTTAHAREAMRDRMAGSNASDGARCAGDVVVDIASSSRRTSALRTAGGGRGSARG